MARYKVTFQILGVKGSIETNAQSIYGADHNLREWLLKKLSVEGIEEIEGEKKEKPKDDVDFLKNIFNMK